MFHVSSFMKNGFTLIELLIVIGIMAILTTIGSVYFFGYRNKQALELTTQELITMLRDAQNKSISQENGKAWGVYFNNTANPKYYDLFFDSPCSPTCPPTATKIASHKILRSGVSFGGSMPSKEVYFNKVTGLPNSSADLNIVISNSTGNKTITIDSNGQIKF